MDELVQRLSASEQPVELGLRPDRTVQALKDALDRGYVHVRFTGTRGGTELGVRLDPAATDVTQADFASGAGKIRLAGNLTLNYQKILCAAEIDLETLTGVGRVTPILDSST
jgi:hypothetical protein